jgi:hypothetical protein
VDSRGISEGKRNGRRYYLQKSRLALRREICFYCAWRPFGRQGNATESNAARVASPGGIRRRNNSRTSPGPDGPGKRSPLSFPGGWRQAERAPPWARPHGGLPVSFPFPGGANEVPAAGLQRLGALFLQATTTAVEDRPGAYPGFSLTHGARLSFLPKAASLRLGIGNREAYEARSGGGGIRSSSAAASAPR